MKLGLFVRARRGFTPAPDLLSLLRQRKQATKGDPDACAPACGWGALRCAKSGPRPKTHCAHYVRSAQTVGPSQCLMRARARGPALLCSSAWHRGGPEQPSSQQPNTEQHGLTRLRRFPAVGCSAAAPMRCREAQLGWAARVSARSLLTRPKCLNGVSAANAVSFGPAQASEHRRGPLGKAKGRRIGAVFFASFLARARKGVACRGEIPAGSFEGPAQHE